MFHAVFVIKVFFISAALPFNFAPARSSHGSYGLVASTVMKTSDGLGVISSEGHNQSFVWKVRSESWISRLKDPLAVDSRTPLAVSSTYDPLVVVSSYSHLVVASSHSHLAVSTSHAHLIAVSPAPLFLGAAHTESSGTNRSSLPEQRLAGSVGFCIFTASPSLLGYSNPFTFVESPVCCSSASCESAISPSDSDSPTNSVNSHSLSPTLVSPTPASTPRCAVSTPAPGTLKEFEDMLIWLYSAKLGLTFEGDVCYCFMSSLIGSDYEQFGVDSVKLIWVQYGNIGFRSLCLNSTIAFISTPLEYKQMVTVRHLGSQMWYWILMFKSRRLRPLLLSHSHEIHIVSSVSIDTAVENNSPASSLSTRGESVSGFKLVLNSSISTLARAISGNIQSKEVIGIAKGIRLISSGFAPFASSVIVLVDVLARKALSNLLFFVSDFMSLVIFRPIL